MRRRWRRGSSGSRLRKRRRRLSRCTRMTVIIKDSVALAWGIDGKAKAALGSYIALAEWERDENGYKLVCARMHEVDGKIIKPDAFYKLKGGKFVEVKK